MKDNYVAKHSRKFNTAKVFDDRKVKTKMVIANTKATCLMSPIGDETSHTVTSQE
jgi:hypothetical protein